MFRRKRIPARRPTQPVKHLFHGIAVQPGEGACDAVCALAQRRFLSEEAPRLPLDTCTDPACCRCVYRHFTDRRTSVRREADLGLPLRFYDPEQRSGPGRRVTDG